MRSFANDDMFKNPLKTNAMKREVKKLHKNVKSMALKKALRTGSRDEYGRVRPDADRNRED